MTEPEAVQPGAVVQRGARRVVVPERWRPAEVPGSGTTVAARVRALTAGPLLPVSALAVTAVAVVRAAVRVARLTRSNGRPGGRDVSGPGPGPTWVQVSWTHVEIRHR